MEDLAGEGEGGGAEKEFGEGGDLIGGGNELGGVAFGGGIPFGLGMEEW